MFSKSFPRILVSALLLTLLLASLATPALAFDGRGGENITIPVDETVSDDLYVGANNFTLDGTVKGDVVASGSVITINGTIEGDLIAAAQTIIINGHVTGSARIAGGALLVTEKAKIGGDILGAGASLEVRQGSRVGQDLVFFGSQALLAGDIVRNVNFGGGGLEIRGAIGGNVEANVGDADSSGPNPSMYLPDLPIALPSVNGGLTLDPAAKVGGKLVYVSAQKLTIPGGIVAGAVTHELPVVDPAEVVKQPTLAEQALASFLNVVRQIITLLLLGLLLGWLFPTFLATNASHIKSAPLAAFGWGIVTYAAFFFVLLLLLVALIIGAAIFGALTLGGLSGTTVGLGILAMFALTMGFIVAVSFVTKIIVSLLGGQLILSRIKPELAEHKIWPLLVGVVIFAILAALPFVGWLVTMVAVLLGLGALWSFGRASLPHKTAS